MLIHPNFDITGLGPGVIVNKRGSILQYGKCVDISHRCELRPTEDCYDELPLTCHGDNGEKIELYRDPISFFTVTSGVKKSCDEFSIHRVGTKYIAQKPEFDTNYTSPGLLKPKALDREKFFEKMEFKTLGVLSGNNKMNSFAKTLMIQTKRIQFQNVWGQGMASGKFKPENFGPEFNEEMSIMSQLRKEVLSLYKIVQNAFFKYGGHALFIFCLTVVAYILLMYICGSCRSTCKHGCNSEESRKAYCALCCMGKDCTMYLGHRFGVCEEKNGRDKKEEEEVALNKSAVLDMASVIANRLAITRQPKSNNLVWDPRTESYQRK